MTVDEIRELIALATETGVAGAAFATLGSLARVSAPLYAMSAPAMAKVQRVPRRRISFWGLVTLGSEFILCYGAIWPDGKGSCRTN